MEPFIKHTGLVAPMDRANVDTEGARGRVGYP